MFITILMVLALVLLALQTAGVGSPPRFSLGWAGLTFWALAVLLAGNPSLLRL